MSSWVEISRERAWYERVASSLAWGMASDILIGRGQNRTDVSYDPSVCEMIKIAD